MWEGAFGLEYFAHRAVDRFDGVGGVDDVSDVFGEVEVGREPVPVLMAQLAHRWVLRINRLALPLLTERCT